MKILLILVSIFFTNQASAQFNDAEEFGNWMMGYYQNPTPQTIVPVLLRAHELKLLSDTAKAGPPLFGFISGVVKNNPEMASLLAKDLEKLGGEEYGIILIGIWYANIPDGVSKKVVNTALKNHKEIAEKFKFLSDEPIDLIKLDPKQGPWVLDAMWGDFFATGNSEPIKKIISILSWIDPSKKEEIIAMGKPGIYLLATSGAAKWSLTSNARHHKKVMEICTEQISKESEPILSQLKEIVSKAKAN